MTPVSKLNLALDALRQIADPIGELQKRLKPGEHVDGAMAIALMNSADYLRGVAQKAIYQITGERGD